jgi:hypothetical protein
MYMQLAEPRWRSRLAQLLGHAKKTGDLRALESAIQEHLHDNFDNLVQAIVRKRVDEAVAILKKRYPGSLERQLQIEAALRGTMEGP